MTTLIHSKPPGYRAWIFAAAEGILVMGIELTLGHEIALTCGSNLQVWALVLSLTMGGLCMGYLIGAYRQPQVPFSSALRKGSLAVGSVSLLSLLPVTEWTSGMPPLWRAACISMLFLALPMGLLGQMIPLLLKAHPQISPGKVFAVSTASGVGTAFVIGFVLFDAFDPQFFLFAIGLFAVVIGLIYETQGRAWHMIMFVVVISGFLGRRWEGEELLWKKNNLFGQVALEEDLALGTRSLQFNGLTQTSVRIQDSCSTLPYVHQIAILGSTYPAGSRSLVLGLGGGTVYNSLRELGHSVTACEWNPHIAEAATAFFGAESSGIVVDDARHHVRRLKGLHDFIVLDCFFGESPPWHVLTIETIFALKEHLSQRGMIVSYFPKGNDGERLASDMMVNTFLAAGLQLAVLETPMGSNPGQVFVATRMPFSYSTYSPFRHTRCSEKSGFSLRIPYKVLQAIPGTGHFDDDHPLLERLERPLRTRK